MRSLSFARTFPTSLRIRRQDHWKCWAMGATRDCGLSFGFWRQTDPNWVNCQSLPSEIRNAHFSALSASFCRTFRSHLSTKILTMARTSGLHAWKLIPNSLKSTEDDRRTKKGKMVRLLRLTVTYIKKSLKILVVLVIWSADIARFKLRVCLVDADGEEQICDHSGRGHHVYIIMSSCHHNDSLIEMVMMVIGLGGYWWLVTGDGWSGWHSGGQQPDQQRNNGLGSDDKKCLWERREIE